MVHETLAVVKALFAAVGDAAAQPTVVALEQDSQDYGDASFMEEFLATLSCSRISNINTLLFQMIANLFTETNPHVETVSSLIDTWTLGISILVSHRQLEWKTFLQYGGDWERLRSTNSKASRAWCPYILTRILTFDRNAYAQGRDHFISAWFESVVEPDLERHNLLTELLLNVDENSFLQSPLFTRNLAGKYVVSSDALFEARPMLVTRMIHGYLF